MSNYYTYSFEKLEVYKSSLDLCVIIRDIINNFPKEEKYDLSKQLKRSVDSISANLAEGSGRASNYDQAHFTNISYASGMESINHLNLALKLNYIKQDDYSEIRMHIDKILNQLNALYKYQVNNKETLKLKTQNKP